MILFQCILLVMDFRDLLFDLSRFLNLLCYFDACDFSFFLLFVDLQFF